MDQELYDEFGNYVGPELDSDEEDEDADEDQNREDAMAEYAGEVSSFKM